MGYEAILDPEVAAFIAKTASCYPEREEPPTISQIREDYEAMCAQFAAPHPAGLQVADTVMDAQGLPPILLRWYRPPDANSLPALIYFHGGGFVMGGLESHDSICADLSFDAGLEVMAVDYRLAPEHPFPAALKDVAAAVEYFCATQPGRPFLLAGDSAGGWLAARLSHQLRGSQACLLGQLLIYPALGGDVDKGSYLVHAGAPMLTRGDILSYSQHFWGTENPALQDGPLVQKDFSALPPTLIFAASCDPLCDDGPAYAAKIKAAGGRAECVVEDGLVHAYLRGRKEASKIKDSFTRIVEAARALSRSDWPHEE
jgi:acetyl esterase